MPVTHKKKLSGILERGHNEEEIMLDLSSLLRLYYWKMCFLTYLLSNIIGLTEDLPHN